MPCDVFFKTNKSFFCILCSPKHLVCALMVSQTCWMNFLPHNICKTDLKILKTALFTCTFTCLRSSLPLLSHYCVSWCVTTAVIKKLQSKLRSQTPQGTFNKDPMSEWEGSFRYHLKTMICSMTDLIMDHACAAEWNAFTKVRWLHTRCDFMRQRLDFY